VPLPDRRIFSAVDVGRKKKKKKKNRIKKEEREDGFHHHHAIVNRSVSFAPLTMNKAGKKASKLSQFRKHDPYFFPYVSYPFGIFLSSEYYMYL
jgi:hypothetical protein